MEKLFILLIIFFASTIFGQKMTEMEWDKLALTDKRLLPKYGHLPKTPEEKNADTEFVKTVLENDTTNRKGSAHLMGLGFDYLNKGDLKTAMLRFNQAYLLDSTNTDIYLGYGAIYMRLGNYAKASQQYREGLAFKPENTQLLTDYGKDFLSQFFVQMMAVDTKGALQKLDSAIVYLQKSYEKDPKSPETSFKLSLCYYYKDDCDNAWKYYQIREKLGGEAINEKYTSDLGKKCKRKK